jgi:hypothetical protein
MKHKHHIVPKHAGGTDDSSNIIELSIEDHAEAHKILYEQHGRWQDKIAWLALSGQIEVEEAIRLAQSNGSKKFKESADLSVLAKKAWDTRRKNGKDIPWNKGLSKEENDSLKKSSELNKHYRKLGRLSNIGDIMRDKEFDEEHKKKLSETAKNRPKIKCEFCGEEHIKQMYVRWHGDKCKRRQSNV